jgi:hypothetical protein
MMVSRKRRAITRPSRRGEVLEIITSDYVDEGEMVPAKNPQITQMIETGSRNNAQ